MRTRKIALAVITACLAGASGYALRKSATREARAPGKLQDAQLTQLHSFAFPVWLALNEVQGAGEGGASDRDAPPSREMYILLGDADFVENKLREVFLGLSFEYPQPAALVVAAYGNEAALQSAVASHGMAIVFSEAVTAPRPAEDGPFALYSRLPEKERFFYTAADGQSHPAWVVLREGGTRAENSPDSALWRAACEGDELGAGDALSKGASINSVGDDGDTPLQAAASHGHFEVCKMLLARGAGVDIRGKDGSTALIDAAIDGNEGVIKLLFNKGADVNAVDDSGLTALNVAALNKNAAAVRLLLQHGADARVPNNAGVTPLVMAASNCDVTSFEFLRSADPGSDELRRALQVAREHRCGEIVRLLRREATPRETVSGGR